MTLSHFNFGTCSFSLVRCPSPLPLPPRTNYTLPTLSRLNSPRRRTASAVKSLASVAVASGDPHFCPVAAAVRRVLHLRTAHAPPTQPLASFLDPVTVRLTRLRPADLTATLRLAVTILGATYNFVPTDVSARSLRAAGAMALLCANVDSDRIRLIGRWRSDEMLRYLHVQAEPVMRDFSSRMLHGGAYAFLPNPPHLPP